MEQKNYVQLKNHFIFETFECASAHRFANHLKRYYGEIGYDYTKDRYANVFFEKETDHIFYFDLSNEDDFENKGFAYYLEQLPSLELSDVAYMFKLIGDEKNLRKNAFKFPSNYPSLFGKAALQNTYGNVIYTTQLMNLIDACLTGSQRMTKSINEYKRLYNCRAASVFREIENMVLPDSYPLSNLLKEFNLLGNQGNDYGFVSRPNYSRAWEFIEKAKKYVR